MMGGKGIWVGERICKKDLYMYMVVLVWFMLGMVGFVVIEVEYVRIDSGR